MTFVIDASGYAIAAAAVTSRIVRTDTETSTFARSPAAEDDPAAVIGFFIPNGWMATARGSGRGDRKCTPHSPHPSGTARAVLATFSQAIH
jgi:hypothetical protein